MKILEHPVPIKLKKGIPIPATQRGARSALSIALRDMEVGDCFDVPWSRAKRTGVYPVMKRLGIKLTVRTLKNGHEKILRVWRIK